MTYLKTLLLIVLFFLLLFCANFFLKKESQNELKGKVIKVVDGDTVNIMVENETVKVRLYGIDAPELKQNYGKKSRQILSDMTAGKTVIVKKTGIDRYNRTVGIIIYNGVDVNAKLVEDGWAWYYKKYSHDNRLEALETKARRNKIGLWQDEHPLAPWEFRSNENQQRQKTH